MSHTHELKIWPEHFIAILEDRKRFEIRSVEDRSFDEGDLLHLREWDPTDPPHYTGREMTVKVTLVHAGLGTAQGYVVMGIQIAWAMASESKTKLAAFANSDLGTKWNGDEADPQTISEWADSPISLCKPRIAGWPKGAVRIEKEFGEVPFIARIKRLERHVAKLKRKLASHKRRSGARVKSEKERANGAGDIAAMLMTKCDRLKEELDTVREDQAFYIKESQRVPKEHISLLESKIKLLKAEKTHLSLELRYYEGRAHNAEKELHRMGSHGSVVAIPASRFDELERAEKALKALEGNVGNAQSIKLTAEDCQGVYSKGEFCAGWQDMADRLNAVIEKKLVES